METLRLYAGFYATPAPIDHLLELCGLQDQACMRNKRLSGGQQRRLDVALVLVGNPELLFLDEPTTGFDPAARRGAWRMIEGLKALGTTIVLTTHYIEEAEILADWIAIVVQGHVVAEGTPTELGGRDRAATTITFRLAEGTPGPAARAERVAGSFRLETGDATRVLHEISGWAIDRDVVLEDVEVRRPSLEDVYLELTQGAHDSMTVSIDHDHDHAGPAPAVETTRNGRVHSMRSRFSMVFHQARYEGLGMVRNPTAQGSASACRSHSSCSSSPSSATARCTSTGTP